MYALYTEPGGLKSSAIRANIISTRSMLVGWLCYRRVVFCAGTRLRKNKKQLFIGRAKGETEGTPNGGKTMFIKTQKNSSQGGFTVECPKTKN